MNETRAAQLWAAFLFFCHSPSRKLPRRTKNDLFLDTP
jgi:hypothetical protein